MNAAIYIRVSTGMQATEGHSLDVQEEQCLGLVQSLGCQKVDVAIFREAGASGEDMDRPELMRLLDEVKQGRFDTVVVKHPDRLSRNMADKAIIVRELQKAGIQLLFVDVPDWNTSDEAQLLFNIIGSIAEYELRQIRRRTLSGKLRAARDGQVMPMGIHPYGYHYEDGQLHILEDEAKYVRLMFRWYADECLSYRDIADRLNRLGVPTKTKRNSVWSHGAVQRILSNELYIGKYMYNRRITKKSKAQSGRKRGRKVTGWHDEQDWITIDVPPVVDEVTFYLAKRRRETRKHSSVPGRRYPHLLQGLVVCQTCGARWHVAGYRSQANEIQRFYRRPAKRSNEVSKNHCLHQCQRIRAVDLEAAVWHQVVHTLVNSKVWRDRAAQFKSQTLARLKDERRLFSQQLESVRQQQERLVNLYVSGDLSDALYQQRKHELGTAAGNLQNHLHEVTQAANDMESRSAAEIEALSNLLIHSESMGSSLPIDVKESIIRQLVTEVAVDAKGSQVHVLLQGAIEQLLSL